MAFTKVGELAFTVAVGGGSENKTLPGTVLENDIVIVVLATDSAVGTAPITTAGYVNIFFDTGLANLGHQVAYKRMGSTPDSVVAISQDDLSIFAGLIQVWRGADTTTASDATPTSASAGAGMPDAPIITTVTDRALVFAIGLLDDDDAAASVTAPASYGDLLAGDTGQASTTVGATAMIASRVLVEAGLTNPAAFGGTGSDLNVGITFALRWGGIISFTMTAGADFGVVGYFNPPTSIGAIDVEPIPGETLISCAHDPGNVVGLGPAFLQFNGDLTALLTTQSVFVDGVEFPSASGWEFDAGADATNYIPDDTWVFVDTEQYFIEIKDAGGGGDPVELDIPATDVAAASVAPTVASGASVVAPATNLALAVLAPAILIGALIGVPVTNVSVATLAPTIEIGVAINAPETNITVDVAAPNILAGVLLGVPATNINVDALAPNVGLATFVAVPVTDIAVAASAPSLATGVAISAPMTDLSAAVLAPDIFVGASVAVPAINLGADALAPEVGLATSIAIPATDIGAAAAAPDIQAGAAIIAPVTNVAAIAQAPSILAGAEMVETPAERIAAVAAENRIATASADTRIASVSLEDRSTSAIAEDRVAAENRIVTANS